MILQVTRRLAAEKNSYNDITIEAVSRQAHVAKTTIYRWWKTKFELVREACFVGSLTQPNTGSLREDLGDLISQEAGISHGKVTRGVVAGFLTDFIERNESAEAVENAPKRFLQLAIEGVMQAADQRGEDLGHMAANEITDLIEMTLYHRCILRGQSFTEDLKNNLLTQVLPAA